MVFSIRLSLNCFTICSDPCLIHLLHLGLLTVMPSAFIHWIFFFQRRAFPFSLLFSVYCGLVVPFNTQCAILLFCSVSYSLANGNLCPLKWLHRSLSIAVLSGTRNCGLTLLQPGISHFPKELCFLLVGNGLLKPRSGC